MRVTTGVALAALLTVAAGARAQTGATPTTQTITPGSGALTDSAGNTFVITPDGSLLENGSIWVAGGGGTAALADVDGTLYGEDAFGRGWFALSAGGQSWTPAAAPAGVTASALTQSAPASSGAAPSATPSATPSAAAYTTAATPTAAASAPATGPAACTTATTGSFTFANGQITDPAGQPWVARGINVYDSDMGDARQILADFPGINFIRLAAYRYQAPAAYAAFIQAMTAAGVVVAIEDHTNSTGSNSGGGQGVAYSGAPLLNEGGWYSALASANAANPYVWFGTDNEPPAAGLTAWQDSTYNAIRSAGNTNPILLELAGGGEDPQAAGMDLSVYAQMVNVGVDAHYYGWVSGDSTDQGTVNADLAAEVRSAQAIKSTTGTVPVIIAEYGVSTTGESIDPNGMQVVDAVNSLTAGNQGGAAWNLDANDCCNNLTSPIPSLTNPYGTTVAGFIANGGSSGPATVASAPAVATVAAPPAATCPVLTTAQANTAAIESAATGVAQPGAASLVLSIDQGVLPAPASTQGSTAATSSSGPVTSTPGPQAQAADNLQQADQVAATVNTPQVQQQVQSLINQAQAAMNAANGGSQAPASP